MLCLLRSKQVSKYKFIFYANTLTSANRNCVHFTDMEDLYRTPVIV